MLMGFTEAGVMPFDFAREGLKTAAQRSAKAKHRSWAVGDQTVIAGDCLSELRNLPDNSIEVIVTSPPYNIGVRYRSYDDRKPRAAYLAWLAEIGAELRRVLNASGSFFLNVGST